MPESIALRQELRPRCNYMDGCENVSNFHGFGYDCCWPCYTKMIAERFRPTGNLFVAEPQMELQFQREN